MRLLVLALALFASTAAGAQERLEPRAPSGPGTVLMSLGGLAASVGVVMIPDGDWVLLAPVASGATVYGIGELLGYDGGLLETMGGAVLGGAIGVGVIYISAASSGDLDDDAIAGIVIGALLYVTLPPALATAGYDLSVAPSIHRAPDGEAAPGVALRIGL